MMNVGNAPETVPSFGLRHRLGLALEVGGVTVAAMADELGVSRNTVGNYLAGRTAPQKAVLLVWALRTGVSYEWLSGADSRSKLTNDECYSVTAATELVAA